LFAVTNCLRVNEKLLHRPNCSIKTQAGVT